MTFAVSAVNYVGVRWGARVNNLTSYAKIAALLAFAALGPLLGRGDAANLLPVFAGASATSLPALGLAFSPILFSYLGWNASVYVASEIERPERNIPASLFLGLGICTLLYMIVNAVYLFALPDRCAQPGAERGRGGGARSLRAGRRLAGRRLRGGLDPGHPQRDRAGRPAHRLRDGAR